MPYTKSGPRVVTTQHARRPGALWTPPQVKAAMAVGAATAMVIATVLVITGVHRTDAVAVSRIVVLLNADANVAGNGLELARHAVADDAASLAAGGGGELVVLKAAGGAAQVAARTDLSVNGPDGGLEHDDVTRARTVGARIDETFTAAAAAPVTEPGRNLLALLTAAESLRPPDGSAFLLYYIGFGLATADPLDARVQLSMDPSQAVADVAGRLPALPGAQLHLFFPAAAGPQPALNTMTEQWRHAFWEQLAQATGSTVVETSEPNIPAPPAVGAPDAPVITNLSDVTRHAPTATIASEPTSTPAPQPTPVPPPVVLGAAAFQPDSPQFVDAAATAVQLNPLAQAWVAHPGSYVAVNCIGRTAAYGTADGARALSQQRASQAAAALEQMAPGIRVDATGIGFDDPLRGYAITDPAQRTVTCTLTPAN